MLMSLRQRTFVDGPACADGLLRSASKNARRVIDSPLFLECCDVEVATDGADGRDGAGCDDDPDAGAGADAGGSHGAFFGRGMITGRSDDASTDCRNGEREVEAHDDDDECAGGSDDIGAAAPAGSGGTAMETGGWLNVGTGGPLLLPGVGTSCASQGVLELPDGMSGCAIDSGDGVCI